MDAAIKIKAELQAIFSFTSSYFSSVHQVWIKWCKFPVLSSVPAVKPKSRSDINPQFAQCRHRRSCGPLATIQISSATFLTQPVPADSAATQNSWDEMKAALRGIIAICSPDVHTPSSRGCSVMWCMLGMNSCILYSTRSCDCAFYFLL